MYSRYTNVHLLIYLLTICQGILFSGLTLDWFGSLPLCVYWSSLI